MQIIEIGSGEIEKTFKITIPAQSLREQLEARLEGLRETTRMNGFRTGKVPMNIIRRRYASELQREIIKEQLEQAVEQATQDLRVLGTPHIRPLSDDNTSFQGDREYELTCYIAPEFEICDLAQIELERLVVEIDQDEVAKVLSRLAEQHRASKPVDNGHSARRGDVLVADIVGSFKGEVIPEFAEQDRELDLDDPESSPEFTQQLIGLQVGDQKTFEITTPPDYPVRIWVGRVISFQVTVKSIRAKMPPAVDDDLAQRLGCENLDGLVRAARHQIGQQYGHRARMLLKQQLLDHLEQRHEFPVPSGIVASEYRNLLSYEGQKDESLSEAVRQEYLALARRRVRVGLLFEKLAHQHQIGVTDEELQLAAKQWLHHRYGDTTHKISPQQLGRIRDMLFEDKVFTFAAAQMALSERRVSPEELRELELGQERISRDLLQRDSVASSAEDSPAGAAEIPSTPAEGKSALAPSSVSGPSAPDKAEQETPGGNSPPGV